MRTDDIAETQLNRIKPDPEPPSHPPLIRDRLIAAQSGIVVIGELVVAVIVTPGHKFVVNWPKEYPKERQMNRDARANLRRESTIPDDLLIDKEQISEKKALLY